MPGTAIERARGRVPGWWARWGLVLGLGLLTAAALGVAAAAWFSEPGDSPPAPAAVRNDAISGEPMFNRLEAAGGGWEVTAWTTGRYLRPSSTLTLVLDFVTPNGQPPSGTVRVVATAPDGRQWAADLDLAGRATAHAEPSGRRLYRVRLENPVPEFPRMAKGPGFAQVTAGVRCGPPGELRFEANLALQIGR